MSCYKRALTSIYSFTQLQRLSNGMLQRALWIAGRGILIFHQESKPWRYDCQSPPQVHVRNSLGNTEDSLRHSMPLPLLHGFDHTLNQVRPGLALAHVQVPADGLCNCQVTKVIA